MMKMDFLKKISSTFLIVVLASCQYEPVDPKVPINPVKPQMNVAGKYKMIAYNTTIETDLNKDGVLSKNQMNETTCFNANYITIQEDNTFLAGNDGITIVSDGIKNSLDCEYTLDISGTWELNANILTLNFIQNNKNFTQQFVVNKGTLTRNIEGEKIVSISNSNAPIFLNSNVELIYTLNN